jgi:hypothetical protein
MIGFTCGEHIATSIGDREPSFCRRWVPGFARCCGDCGAPVDRGMALVAKVLAGIAFTGKQGGNVDKTVRLMATRSARHRARKAERTTT